MAFKLKELIANIKNFGSKRSLSKIMYIVIHFTANDGDTDEANAKYFKNNVVKASAHYFVDSDSVTQSVEDDHIAYSVGGKKYASCSTTGGGKYYGKCTNAKSISIELCDDVKNGVIYPSDATIENALALTRQLMKKYGIPKERVIRHFDVVGKICPGYWAGTAAKNKKWLTEFWNRLDESDTSTSATNTSTSASTFKSYKVKVTSDTLNIRKGASAGTKIMGVITDNQKLIKKNPNYYFPKSAAYTIVGEKMNGKTKWGKLKSGIGYISLGYTKKV